MFSAVAAALATVDPRLRRRWFLLVGLALFDATFEAFGATSIYVLVRVVTKPEVAHTTIVVSSLRDLFSGLSDDGFVVVLGVIVATFYVAKNSLLLFESYSQARLANDAGADTASRLLRGYFAAPWSFHFDRSSAQLQRNVMSVVDTVYRSVLQSGSSLISDSLVAIGMLVVLFISAPLVTPVAALTLGLLLLVTYKLTNARFRRWGAETQALVGENIQTLQQSLGAMKEIKLLGREAHFERDFEVARRRLASILWKTTTALVFPRLAMETVFVVIMVLVVSIVTVQGEAQGTAVALFGLYGYAGFRLLPSVNRIVNSAGNIRLGEAAIALLQADLDATASYVSPTEPSEPMAFGEEIRLESLHYRYPGTSVDVLRSIDLVIGRGEMVGLMGATGSGKSTLADVLMGLLPPTEGRVLVDGHDIAEDLRGWQRNIGYVAQDTFLHQGTLRENIALGVPDDEIDAERVLIAIGLAHLDDVVDGLPLGADSPIGEHGVRLSGGQRQRIAIARALYHDPDVLVFDEATSSLDNRIAGEVTRAISGLAGSRTLLVIAHRVESVQACERVVFLEHGRIDDMGTFDELVQRNAAFRRTIDHLDRSASG